MDDDPGEDQAMDRADNEWDEPPPPLSAWVRLIALVTVIALLIASIWWISLL
jgi:hypothetical protein